MKSIDFGLSKEWISLISSSYDISKLNSILGRYEAELAEGKILYPPKNDLFKAFSRCSPENVKVVILGQDPYHGEGQAHGLSFSVPDGVKQPPSLKNIFKELKEDTGIEIPESGNLESWADQGVLLLNTCLSVESGKAASHKNWGWQEFTDAIFENLAKKHDNLVYILWGSFAQKKKSFVDESKNLVICSPHPSPLSSYRGFFGSKPFSKAKDYLSKKRNTDLNWNL